MGELGISISVFEEMDLDLIKYGWVDLEIFDLHLTVKNSTEFFLRN